MKLFNIHFSPSFFYLSFLGLNILLSILFSSALYLSLPYGEKLTFIPIQNNG